MTTKEMKAIYEATPRYWIVVMRYEYSWQIVSDDIFPPIFNGAVGAHTEYKLIHIKHKHILEAYLADNSVEIEYLYVNEVIKLAEWRTFKKDFIESYSPDLEYRLNGCNHSELDSCAKCDPGFMKVLMTDKEYEHLESASEVKEKEDEDSGKRHNGHKLHDTSGQRRDDKDKEVPQQKEKEEEEINNFSDFSFSDCGFTANHKVDDTYIGYVFNIKKSKINNFQDYGFTADFEGEILKDFKTSFFGYIIERCPDDSGNYYSYCQWDRDGKAYRDNKSFSQYNLTPIKKEWYEQRPLKFPFAVSDTFKIRIVRCYDDLALAVDSGYDKATKEEVMSLYFEGKE